MALDTTTVENAISVSHTAALTIGGFVVVAVVGVAIVSFIVGLVKGASFNVRGGQ